MNHVSQEVKDELRKEMLEDNFRESQAMSLHRDKLKEDEMYLMEHCGICEVSQAVDEVVEKLNSEGFLYTRKEVLEYLMQE